MKSILRLGCIAFVVSVASCRSLATAQASVREVARPNLAGTWKLDVSQSNYGKNGKAPAGALEVINQSGDDITVAVSILDGVKPVKYSYKVRVGAPEAALPQDQYGLDDEVKIQSLRAVWMQGSLVVTLNATAKSDPTTIEAHYTISPDGTRLTKVSNIDRDAGKLYTIEVFKRD